MAARGLRVVGGEHSGRRLRGPAGPGTRPTADRVREAIFALLGDLVPGARVLDLYAGTGALAIEALSRGARHADLVEVGPRACVIIRHNLALASVADRARVLRLSVERALPVLVGPYDLVLADPPYAEADVPGLLGRLDSEGLVAPEGRIVVEHSSRLVAPDKAAGFGLWKRRRYGDATVSIYRPAPETQDGHEGGEA